MTKTRAQRYAEAVQRALPHTHDVSWLAIAKALYCVCQCPSCPPWDHSVADCSQLCERWDDPHRVIRGYTDSRDAAAPSLVEASAVDEKLPE
jgi:hypothetical protein